MSKKVGNGSKKGKILPLVFLLLFVVGLFFLSPNITGNAIGGMDNSRTNLLGISFLVLGILGYYFVSKFLGSFL